jgi:hypothetical protein
VLAQRELRADPWLALAHAIVAAHGGAVGASCTPRHGTTIVLALPLRR